MRQSALGSCLFFKKHRGNPTGIIGTLVDDTLGAGNSQFETEEEVQSKEFDVKKKNKAFPMKFAGLCISKIEKGFKTDQKAYKKTMKVLDPKSASKKQFSHVLGQLGYIANGTRPDVCFDFSSLSRLKSEEPNPRSIRYLNSCVKEIQKMSSR